MIDKDDPTKDELLLLETKGLAQIVQLEGVGAERFAASAWNLLMNLFKKDTDGRVWCELQSVVNTEQTAQSYSYLAEDNICRWLKNILKAKLKMNGS